MERYIKKILCDRCFKDITNDKIIRDIDNLYEYVLCENCHHIFHDYKEQISFVNNKIKNIQKCLKFGEYLPKYQEKENE